MLNLRKMGEHKLFVFCKKLFSFKFSFLFQLSYLSFFANFQLHLLSWVKLLQSLNSFAILFIRAIHNSQLLFFNSIENPFLYLFQVGLILIVHLFFELIFEELVFLLYPLNIFFAAVDYPLDLGLETSQSVLGDLFKFFSLPFLFSLLFGFGPDIFLLPAVFFKILFYFFVIQLQKFNFLQQLTTSANQFCFLVGQFFDMLELSFASFLFHLDFLSSFLGNSNPSLFNNLLKCTNFLLIWAIPVGKVIFLIGHLKLKGIQGSFEFNNFEFGGLELIHIFQVLVVLHIDLMSIVLYSEIIFFLHLDLAAAHHLLQISTFLWDQVLEMALLAFVLFVLGYLLLQVGLHSYYLNYRKLWGSGLKIAAFKFVFW